MKTRYLILGTALCSLTGLGLTSCDNEKFLEVKQTELLASDAMFESDANAIQALTGCYDLMLPSNTSGHNGDPFKPYVFTTSHPTMDSQASGWDKAFCVQGWNAQTTELNDGWKHAYAAIVRCNDFLSGLENVPEGQLSDDVRKHLEGEAHALRGYQFHWLATTFGRVPMLKTGENYTNTPYKERAQTHKEMWDFIIEDFQAAANLLDWEPFQGQYGRCTKGMALAYLGDAYMWLSYRTGEDHYAEAKAVFKQIIDSGTYELNPSFSTLFDADEVWGKEAIWQEVLNEGENWGSWDGSVWSEAHGWVGFYYGAPANGAWGTYACSYELYDAYENYLDDPVYGNAFDKRRDASLVTASMSEELLKSFGKNDMGDEIVKRWQQRFRPEAWLASPDNAQYLEGYEDFLTGKKKVATIDRSDEGNNVITYNPNCPIGFNPFAQEWVGYSTPHREKGDIQPTVYSTKHWRNGRGTHWSGDQWLPDHIYMKRLANVYLDYAECCFRTGDAAEGWKYVDAIRNRAFGNLEVGKSAELTQKFTGYFKWCATYYTDNGFGKWVSSDAYPIPFNEETVKFPSAEEYYTKLKQVKGFDSEVWKIAVNEERRKEFNAEWSLKTDLQKSDYLVDHMNHNYPKGYGHETGIEQIYEWRTYRGFDFDINKMDMPIPQDELIKNPLCDQNEAYRAN